VNPLACDGIRALLVDIEGTTTPISFVHDVLFPYARANLRSFLTRRAAEAPVRKDLERLRAEHAAEAGAASPPKWPQEAALEPAVTYLEFLMDRDRKSTGLKALQGRIWEEGYGSGRLRGEVYPDVPPAFERWRGQGRRIAIFSSGSVLAQKLLFATVPAGDLTLAIDGFFDTTTGPKREPGSYRRITEALGLPPTEVLFLSDVTEELDAARVAGLETALCVRAAPPPASAHPIVTDFTAVCP
jgi:enolase-phosphatase E1